MQAMGTDLKVDVEALHQPLGLCYAVDIQLAAHRMHDVVGVG